MPPIKHVHKDGCSRYEYKEWVCHVAPDVLWFDVQDVGIYQGQVFGLGVYKNQAIFYEDYYGSCSGCGAWGEDGEPQSQEEVFKKSKFFSTKKEILKYLASMGGYEKPDMNIVFKCVDEIFQDFIKS